MIKGLERVDTTGALKLPNSDDNYWNDSRGRCVLARAVQI